MCNRTRRAISRFIVCTRAADIKIVTRSKCILHIFGSLGTRIQLNLFQTFGKRFSTITWKWWRRYLKFFCPILLNLRHCLLKICYMKHPEASKLFLFFPEICLRIKETGELKIWRWFLSKAENWFIYQKNYWFKFFGKIEFIAGLMNHQRVVIQDQLINDRNMISRISISYLMPQIFMWYIPRYFEFLSISIAEFII